MKALAYISLRFSLSLLLIHSFIPHHHQHLANESHERNSVSSEWIVDLVEYFHADLGKGHLEHFDVNSASNPIKKRFALIQAIESNRDPLLHSKNEKEASEKTPWYLPIPVEDLGIIQEISGRAPPLLV